MRFASIDISLLRTLSAALRTDGRGGAKLHVQRVSKEEYMSAKNVKNPLEIETSRSTIYSPLSENPTDLNHGISTPKGSSAAPQDLPFFARSATSEKQEEKTMHVSPTGGLRDNLGKPELSLVPMSLNVAVAKVLRKSSIKGGGKYPEHNWRKGMEYSETASCALRHLYKWLGGEDADQETGLNHLYHAACNLAFLIEYLETHPELDDRFKGEK